MHHSVKTIGYNNVKYDNLNSVEKYDPTTDLWSPSMAFPDHRHALTATTIHACIYAVGGRIARLNVATAYKMCRADGKWEAIARMATARVYHAAAGMYECLVFTLPFFPSGKHSVCSFNSRVPGYTVYGCTATGASVQGQGRYPRCREFETTKI